MQTLNEKFINSLLHNEQTNSFSSFNDLNSLQPTHTNLAEVNHVRELSLDIGKLFTNTDYSDITLVVENVEFRAHKIILAARSDYFRALLYSGMRESLCERIEISETRSSTFRLLLQYIYTGKLSLRSTVRSGSGDEDSSGGGGGGGGGGESSVLDLLGCVHKYGFVELQQAVSDYLESILDTRNVCSIYDMALLYQLDKLEHTCVRFIDRNCATLIKSPTLLLLTGHSLANIIARDSFCAPELEIFQVVKKWHEINNVEKAKSELISKIRLPLMKLDELLNEVRESSLISSNVILDAIKLKHESTDMSLNYRGCLYQNENIASSRYQAVVTKGEFKSALLDGDVNNYDFDRGFTYHPIDDANQNAIIVKLGNPSIFNEIKLLLWDKDIRSYSYFVEVSMNEKDWIRIMDYSNYLCRSWQNLHFKPVVARYIKVVGVRNTANRIFHLVSMECRYTTEKYSLQDQLIVPHYNVASVNQSAFVLEGVSRTRNALINGDFKSYDWDSGYTCHQLGSGSISIQLAQPFLVASMRLLLWDCDNRSYSYCIETSVDQVNWKMIADKREQACKSWQIIEFEPTVVSFVKITGTHNTANEVFHCVHFECPCDRDVLARFKEQQQTKSDYNNKQYILLNSSSLLSQHQQHQHQHQQQQLLINMDIQQQQQQIPQENEQRQIVDETLSVEPITNENPDEVRMESVEVEVKEEQTNLN